MTLTEQELATPGAITALLGLVDRMQADAETAVRVAERRGYEAALAEIAVVLQDVAPGEPLPVNAGEATRALVASLRETEYRTAMSATSRTRTRKSWDPRPRKVW